MSSCNLHGAGQKRNLSKGPVGRISYGPGAPIPLRSAAQSGSPNRQCHHFLRRCGRPDLRPGQSEIPLARCGKTRCRPSEIRWFARDSCLQSLLLLDCHEQRVGGIPHVMGVTRLDQSVKVLLRHYIKQLGQYSGEHCSHASRHCTQ
jgi:hypothetical protein